jgi:uncharacterized membrane protein YkoI
MHIATRITAAAAMALAAAGGLLAAEGDAPATPASAAEAPAPAAGPLTMQMAVEKALAQRPGEVMGTDRERKRGREAWEVEIRDADGQLWELYYAIDDGTLLDEERD